MYKVCIFDLDGTLINSIIDVACACNYALCRHGFPENPIEEYGRFIGGKLENFIGNTLPDGEKTSENIDLVKVTYKEYYAAHCCDRSFVFEGVLEALRELQANGVKICIHSNKAQDLVELVVNKLLVPSLFDEVIGYLPGFPTKPAPDGVVRIIGRFHVSPGDCVYIGDTKVDLQTAANAGIDSIAVLWGQGIEEEMKAYSPTYMIKNPEELTPVILRACKCAGRGGLN